MKKVVLAGLSTILGAVIGGVVMGTINEKVLKKKEEKVDKFKSYYNMLNQWLILKNEGKTLAQFFENKGYHSIAVYGMGEMGNRLYEELKNSGIEIKYSIDKEAGSTYAEIDVKGLEDEWEKVDTIVVTAVFAFDDIEKEIMERVDYPVISLEDIVYEI